MIFQSSLVKTELIFVFEFAVQFLNIPFEYSNNQFEHYDIKEDVLFIFTVAQFGYFSRN